MVIVPKKAHNTVGLLAPTTDERQCLALGVNTTVVLCPCGHQTTRAQLAMALTTTKHLQI